MSYNNNNIETLIKPIIDSEGFKLCRIEVSGNPRSPGIKVFIDRIDGSITIESCAKMSRIIQDILDLQEWSPSNYRLEVSSPGIDFPLRELWQFRKNINRTIELHREDESLKGKIVAADDTGTIELDINGSIRKYTVSELEGAKVMIDIPRKNKHRRK